MTNLVTKVMTPPYFNFVDAENKDFLTKENSKKVELFKLDYETINQTICNSQNL